MGGGYDPEPYPPNDPLYLPTAEFPLGEHWIPTTRVDRAWVLVGYQLGYTIRIGNPNATIAVIDTGIQVAHPEFADKLHPESHSVFEHGVLGQGGSCPCDTTRPLFASSIIGDTLGHGTRTAGLAGGLGDNGEGMAGVC